ncbi:MAG TPA: hypothetical protein VJN63_04065 [Thermoplasmata archaeon]|nr:hypothetical protein [Thermoplasmata archaeon]
MVLLALLPAVTVACLVLALGFFLIRLAKRVRGRGAGTADFGVFFSVFVAGWIATELIDIASPQAWGGGDEVLHFALVFLFAIWMNSRWRWALHKAQERR